MAMYEKSYTTEDDYIESGGVFAELTVTISLCEYRRLVSDDIFCALRSSALRKKMKSSRRRSKRSAGLCLQKALICSTRSLLSLMH